MVGSTLSDLMHSDSALRFGSARLRVLQLTNAKWYRDPTSNGQAGPGTLDECDRITGYRTLVCSTAAHTAVLSAPAGCPCMHSHRHCKKQSHHQTLSLAYARTLSLKCTYAVFKMTHTYTYCHCRFTMLLRDCTQHDTDC